MRIVLFSPSVHRPDRRCAEFPRVLRAFAGEAGEDARHASFERQLQELCREVGRVALLLPGSPVLEPVRVAADHGPGRVLRDLRARAFSFCVSRFQVPRGPTASPRPSPRSGSGASPSPRCAACPPPPRTAPGGSGASPTSSAENSSPVAVCCVPQVKRWFLLRGASSANSSRSAARSPAERCVNA